MHANQLAHEKFIRETIKALNIPEVVYITDNAYDGGYEVKVGSFSFFVEYEIVEGQDAEYIKKSLAGYAG